MYNVYKIVNRINNKVYIGRTVQSLEVRWDGHMKCFNRGDKRHLYCAMRKYGVENFHIELIETCTSFEDMVAKEAYYCAVYNAYTEGYNMTTEGEINPMECEKSRKSHDQKMRSDDVRNKISESMKNIRTNEQKLTMHLNRETKRILFTDVPTYLDKGWRQGTANCRDFCDDGIHIRVYSKDGMREILPTELEKYKEDGWKFSPVSMKIFTHNCDIEKKQRIVKSNHAKVKRIRLHNDTTETTIWPEFLDKYLASGWKVGGKPGRMTEKQKAILANSHKNISDEFRKEQSERLKNFYKSNSDWKTKSKKAVVVTNPTTGESIEADSCLNLVRKLDIPDSIARAGKIKQWVDLGYIHRKSSKYNNWLIKYKDNV